MDLSCVYITASIRRWMVSVVVHQPCLQAKHSSSERWIKSSLRWTLINVSVSRRGKSSNSAPISKDCRCQQMDVSLCVCAFLLPLQSHSGLTSVNTQEEDPNSLPSSFCNLSTKIWSAPTMAHVVGDVLTPVRMDVFQWASMNIRSKFHLFFMQQALS